MRRASDVRSGRPTGAQTPRTMPASARTAPKTQAKVSPYYRDHYLLTEYRELQQHAPNGIYVLPSSSSLLRWDGVIFVRQGDYRGGIFRFIIDIPESYPDARPNLKFVSKVFHPQISADGQINMQHWFPTWTLQKDLIVNVLTLVHKLFLKVSTEETMNKTAAELFTDNKDEFRARVQQCVKSSVDSSAMLPPGCELKFGAFDERHAEVRTKLLQHLEDPRAAIAAVREYCAKAIGSPSMNGTTR